MNEREFKAVSRNSLPREAMDFLTWQSQGNRGQERKLAARCLDVEALKSLITFAAFSYSKVTGQAQPHQGVGMSSHLQVEHMPGLGGTDAASVTNNLSERIDLNLSICLHLAILRIHLWVYEWDQLRMTEQSIRKTITYIYQSYFMV